MKKIAAGIVLFNSEKERLKENVGAIIGQVDYLICFDNGSKNFGELKQTIDESYSIIWIESKENKGIAFALNRIAEKACELGCEWLLTLDDDSVCPSNMVDEFSRVISANDMTDVGMLAPIMYDSRRPGEKPLEKNEIEDIDFCITSGSLVNLTIWNKLGGVDEWMFVGEVDDEYSHRLRILGYRIIQLDNLILDHELGELTPKKTAKMYVKLAKLTGIKKLSSLAYRRKVSPMRMYYSVRNMLYLEKKYKNYPNPKFTKKNAIKNGISGILRGQQKIKIAASVIKGYKEGKKIQPLQFVKVK